MLCQFSQEFLVLHWNKMHKQPIQYLDPSCTTMKAEVQYFNADFEEINIDTQDILTCFRCVDLLN